MANYGGALASINRILQHSQETEKDKINQSLAMLEIVGAERDRESRDRFEVRKLGLEEQRIETADRLADSTILERQEAGVDRRAALKLSQQKELRVVFDRNVEMITNSVDTGLKTAADSIIGSLGMKTLASQNTKDTVISIDGMVTDLTKGKVFGKAMELDDAFAKELVGAWYASESGNNIELVTMFAELSKIGDKTKQETKRHVYLFDNLEKMGYFTDRNESEYMKEFQSMQSLLISKDHLEREKSESLNKDYEFTEEAIKAFGLNKFAVDFTTVKIPIIETPDGSINKALDKLNQDEKERFKRLELIDPDATQSDLMEKAVEEENMSYRDILAETDSGMKEQYSQVSKKYKGLKKELVKHNNKMENLSNLIALKGRNGFDQNLLDYYDGGKEFGKSIKTDIRLSLSNSIAILNSIDKLRKEYFESGAGTEDKLGFVEYVTRGFGFNDIQEKQWTNRERQRLFQESLPPIPSGHRIIGIN